MMLNPKLGQRVQLVYRKQLRGIAPYHDAIGTITAVGKGRPRNHLVRIAGRLVVVPCGHLRSLS